MSIITNLTWSGLPTSGAATAGSTGLSTLTGSPVHTPWSAADPAPPFAAATNGYLRGADNTGSITFRIDGTGVPLQADNDYWVRFGIRARQTSSYVAGSTPADSALTYIHTVSSSGTKERPELRVRNGTVTGFAGLGVNEPNYTASGAVRHLSAAGAANAPATMNPDQFYEIVIHMNRTASGRYEMFINGFRAFVHDGVDYATIIALVDAGSQWTISLSAIAGIGWDVCGPVESWQGTDITVRPRWTESPSNDWCPKRIPLDWVDGRTGDLWTKSGTSSFDVTDYTSSGAQPMRRRARTTGGTNGQTLVMTSVDQIGALPYNVNGDVNLVFPMLYWPGGATGSVELKTTGGATLIKLDFDGTNLKQGATTLAPWTAADRYALAICLRNNGEAKCWITSLTKNHAVSASQNVWGADLTAWTPQDIGQVVISTLIGATVSPVCEVDGVWVTTWAGVGATDSISHIDANALTPLMAMPNHLTSNWPRQIGANMPPNASWIWRNRGLPHVPVLVTLGRAGTTRTAFDTYLRPYLNKSPGAFVMVVDGGSINDSTTVVDGPTRDAEVASLLNECQNEINTFTAARVMMGFCTMMRREQSTTTPTYGGPGSFKNQAIDKFNAGLRQKMLANAGNTLIKFMDPAFQLANHLSLFTSGDDTHFNSAGDFLVDSLMANDFNNGLAKNSARLGKRGGFRIGMGIGL